MVFCWMIVLDVTRMMTLHNSRMNKMWLHMTIFRQKTTIPHYGTVQTFTSIEHHLYRRTHLVNIFMECIANLLVRLDVEEEPRGLVTQHSSLFRTYGWICQEPVAGEEDWPFIAVLLRGSHGSCTVCFWIETLFGDYQDVSPNLFIFELIYQMSLFSQKSISANIGNNVPNNGRHSGNVVLINEPKDILERLLIVTLGVVPSHGVHPDGGGVLLYVPDEVTMPRHSLRPAPRSGDHSRVFCHRRALACSSGSHADNATVLQIISISGFHE